MLAIYPANGSRFQKHVDNTARDGRRLTVLCYLNPTWNEADGGELRVFATGDGSDTSVVPVGGGGNARTRPKFGADGRPLKARNVPPTAGRLAMFFADSAPHEVLPAHAMRHAVTVWYYDTDERKSAVSEDPREATFRSPVRLPCSAKVLSLSLPPFSVRTMVCSHIFFCL